MKTNTLVEVNPEHQMEFELTKGERLGYLYLRNITENQLVLVKIDFSQSEAYKIQQSYVVLTPRQSIRIKINLIESMMNLSRPNNLRVQANEVKNIYVHKAAFPSDLKNEWKTNRAHYEGERCQKTLLECVLGRVDTSQVHFLNHTGTYQSAKSMRGYPEELQEISLYPIGGPSRGPNSRPGISHQPSFAEGTLSNHLHPHSRKNSDGKLVIDQPFNNTLPKESSFQLKQNQDRPPLNLKPVEPVDKSHRMMDSSRPPIDKRPNDTFSTELGIPKREGNSVSNTWSNRSRLPVDEFIYTGRGDEIIIEDEFISGKQLRLNQERYKNMLIETKTGNQDRSFRRPSGARESESQHYLNPGERNNHRSSKNSTSGSISGLSFAKHLSSRSNAEDIIRIRNKDNQIELRHSVEDMRKELQKVQFVGVQQAPAKIVGREISDSGGFPIKWVLVLAILALLAGRFIL